MCFTPTFAVFRVPDFVQAVLVEQHRHIEGVARREREVAAEDGDLGRGGHGVVVGLHGVDGAGLHGAEEFAGRNQLVGGVELDLISPLAALLKASIDGLITCSARAGPA
jgi:hypothetical protein